MKPRFLFVGALITAAFALGAATPARAAAKHRCAVPTGATVVARSSTSVAWSRESNAGTEWRGCSTRSGEPVLLDQSNEPYDSTVVSRVRLAGRFAGFVSSFVDHYGSARVVLVVADLRGVFRPVRLALAASEMGEPGYVLQVTGLALDPDGGLAWRMSAGPNSRLVPPDAAGDAAHDAVGTLDSRGAAIVATSAPGTIAAFKLHGGRVTWTVSGAPRGMVLRGRAAPACGRGSCWR
jgi:hypothetical protein